MTRNRRRLRILLIDDEEAIRRSITFVVRTLGHEIVAVASVAEGIVHFSGSPSDVVITDMMMPTGSGLEAVTRIRDLSTAVTIIAVSGSVDSSGTGLLNAARDAGADHCLNKPFSLSELEALLDTVAETLDAANDGAN